MHVVGRMVGNRGWMRTVPVLMNDSEWLCKKLGWSEHSLHLPKRRRIMEDFCERVAIKLDGKDDLDLVEAAREEAYLIVTWKD